MAELGVKTVPAGFDLHGPSEKGAGKPADLCNSSGSRFVI